MKRKFFIVLICSLLLPSPVFGQGAEFFGAGNEEAESNEGLEAATPTDSVNELNSGNNAGNLDTAGDGGNDFSAEEEGGGDFNFGNEGEGGDDFFEDSPANVGNQGNGGAGQPSAFGNQAGGNNAAPVQNSNQNVAPAQQPVQTLNPSLTNETQPAQNAPMQQALPANASPNVPANAQTLMNQIQTDNPAAIPAADGAVPEGAGADQPLAVTEPEPEIEAPPLPMPNEFAGAPPVPGTMRNMAEGEAPEEYAVQPGDTLFDICDQLLDEPAYWPKLWALNPEIKNPHFIFPNMRLRFYPGDDETPPYLQIVAEEDVIPIDKGGLDEEELVAEKVIFEEEVFEEPDTIEVVGPSDVGDASEDAFIVAGRVYEGGDIQVHVPGFIFRDEREPLGFVISGRAGEVNMGPELKAVVENAGGLAAGTLYTVLRRGEEIASPATGDFIGYKYYYIANLRIDRAVDGDVFIGTVSDSILGVMPDDIVVNYISTKRSVPITSGIGSLNSLQANVVGFQFMGQEIGGFGNFAFLDKGNGDGVSAGMYLPVYGTPGYLTTSFGSAELPEDFEFVGVVRIIDATDAGSVGYIMKTDKEMRIGDRTSKG